MAVDLRNAGERLSFLRERPSFERGGFDLDMGGGRIAEASLRNHFGEWEQPTDLADDEDLSAMRSVHEQSVASFRDMVGTLQQVANDDDMTAEARLTTAAKIIEPKMDRLAATAEREFARVDAAIAGEEAGIVEAMGTASATDLAGFEAIRAWWRTDAGQERARMLLHLTELPPEGQDPDPRKIGVAELDTQSLWALATVPAYVTGLSAKQHAAIRDELALRIAPDRVKRRDALRTGKAKALQALAEYGKRAERFVDFRKAKAIREKSKARAERYGVTE